jgi:hypothetical protein
MGWKDRGMVEHARGTFAVTLTPQHHDDLVYDVPDA